MLTRAKVDVRLWTRIESLLRRADVGYYWRVVIRKRFGQEFRRIRVKAYGDGFNEGAEYMRKKLSGRYDS